MARASERRGGALQEGIVNPIHSHIICAFRLQGSRILRCGFFVSLHLLLRPRGRLLASGCRSQGWRVVEGGPA